MSRKVDYKAQVDIYPSSGILNYSVNELTVNYIFPVVPGSTYTITMTEIGNRLRSIFTTANPKTITTNVASGITDIVMNPTFDAGYEFSFTPTDYGYIVVYVSNEGGYPYIDVVSDGAGGDDVYEFQMACTENTGGTTQSASITAVNKGMVLATVTTRSSMIHPEGWTVLQETTILSETNLNQRMAFLCKAVEEGETVTFTATQATSGRIYINLIAIGGAPGLSYPGGTEYITETQVNSHTTQKATDNQVIWGCTANLWDTASTHQRWSCGEITSTVIALPTSAQGRQGNFIDNGAAGGRTFVSGTANTGAIIDYIVIQAPYDKKYLIRSGSTLYTLADGALSALTETEVTAEVFRSYGLDEAPDGALLVGLTDPEVLYWHDSEDALPTLSLTVRGTPPMPQMFTSEPMDLTHESIAGIDHAAVDASADVRCAISFDDGATWIAHDGAAWFTVSDTVPGMLASTMNAITAEQWAEVVQLTAYRVRFWLPNVTAFVKSVVIHYINP